MSITVMCEVDLTGTAAIRVPVGKTEFLSGYRKLSKFSFLLP
jgi:hypothetical protein